LRIDAENDADSVECSSEVQDAKGEISGTPATKNGSTTIFTLKNQSSGSAQISRGVSVDALSEPSDLDTETLHESELIFDDMLLRASK
jgi:hypothetical protein